MALQKGGYPPHDRMTPTPPLSTMAGGSPPSPPPKVPFPVDFRRKAAFTGTKRKGGGASSRTGRHPPPPWPIFIWARGIPPHPSVGGGTTPLVPAPRPCVLVEHPSEEGGVPPPYPEGGGGRPIVKWEGVPPLPLYFGEPPPSSCLNVGGATFVQKRGSPSRPGRTPDLQHVNDPSRFIL
jgi:hypothetical protein